MPLTIQDFALVLGAPCKVLNNGFDNQHNGEEMQVLGVSISMVEVSPGHWWMPTDCLPILRPLSSLTEAEARELYEIAKGEQWTYAAHSTPSCLQNWWNPSGIVLESRFSEIAIGCPVIWRWLLAHHFDLFGWIQQDLAIKQEGV